MRSGFILLAFLLSSISVNAIERAGQLSITEAMLWPTYFSSEGEGGQFQLYRSQFGIGWDLDGSLRTRFLIGSESQRQAPAYYNKNEASEDIAIIEAYADYQGLYGRVRMGLMPLPITYQNRIPDHELIFHDILVFENRLLARRDFGLSFYTGHNGYYTEIMAHNGEVAEDANDGNVWATARWGWSDQRKWQLEYAMQVGRSKAEATSTNGLDIAGFDINETAIWKFSQLSINWYDRKTNVLLEGLYGDIEQDNFKNRVSSYHLDVIHMLKPSLGLGLRYDQIDMNDKVEDDAKTASSLALIFGGENSTSRFFITATQKREEGTEDTNDELRVSWRLRPYF